MNIDVSGVYSPDKIYGQLTVPFNEKLVNINSVSPYDKVDATKNETNAVTQKDFLPDQAAFRIDFDSIREMKGIDLSEIIPSSTPEVVSNEFPPENPNISSFTLSNLDNHDIVTTALKNGFTTDQAVAMSKAMRAYSIEGAKTPVDALNNTVYKAF